MKKVMLVAFMFTTNLYAQEYRSIDSIKPIHTTADISNVVLLGSEIVIEDLTNYQNRSIKVTLGLDTIASACENMKNIEQLSAQRSIDSMLNPTDFYFRVNTEWRPGCTTGSFGEPQYLKLELTYYVDQRPISDRDLPWPAPDFSWGSNVRYLNFDIGMMGGYNRYRMYKLNYVDLNSPVFENIKQFSFVQGSVLEM